MKEITRFLQDKLNVLNALSWLYRYLPGKHARRVMKEYERIVHPLLYSILPKLEV